LERRSNGCSSSSNKYKIIDIDGSEITIEDLIEKYFFNEKYHTICSVVLVKPSNNHAREDESSTMERQTKDNQEDENEEQDLDAYIKRLLTVQLIS
jgi:hypothetical protein